MTNTNMIKERDLMELVDAYVEARHIGGCHTYNAKTADARAKVVASLQFLGFTAADMATASAQGFRDGVASVAASAGSEPVAADGWLHENGLLYRLTDERHPRNRDEINVTMADGSRSIESRSRRALELLDRIRATHPSPPEGMGGGWIASQDQMPPPGVRVFWGDVGSNRVGYDSWAGDDYRWAPSHWMHIPEFPAPPTTSAGSGKGE